MILVGVGWGWGGGGGGGGGPVGGVGLDTRIVTKRYFSDLQCETQLEDV